MDIVTIEYAYGYCEKVPRDAATEGEAKEIAEGDLDIAMLDVEVTAINIVRITRK